MGFHLLEGCGHLCLITFLNLPSDFLLSFSQERVSDTSAKAPNYIGTRPNVPSYPPPMLPVDDDDISYKGSDIFICPFLILLW